MIGLAKKSPPSCTASYVTGVEMMVLHSRFNAQCMYAYPLVDKYRDADFNTKPTVNC